MKIYDLNEKVSFSHGKPIPNDFLDANGFRASLVCLKAGTEIPPHPEEYGVFLIVLEGSGVFTDANGESELTKNQGIFIEGGEIRGVRSREDLVILGIRDTTKGENK